MISLRTMANSAIRITARTCTTLSVRSVTSRRVRLNSSAIMTVKIMPNTLWNAARSVRSNVSDRTRLYRILIASFQMAETMMMEIKAVRTRNNGVLEFEVVGQ